MLSLFLKTTLKCDGCVAKVKPLLDAEPSIQHWEADISGPVKTLKIEGDGVTLEKVQEILAKAGYKAELMPG